MKNKITILLILSLMLIHIVCALEVTTEILSKYKIVAPGEVLKFQVDIKNIEVAGRHDISLEYIAKQGDFILAKSKELKAVETQSSFIGELKIPDIAVGGRYELEVIINGKESSTDTFEVKRLSENILNYLLVISISILVVVLLILLEVHQISKRQKKSRR